MPFVPILGAAQVNVKGQLLGQEYENVWGVQCSAPPDLAELESIAAVFQTQYVGILNTLSNNLSISEIEVRYLGAATGPTFQLFISPPLDGASSSDSMPGNVALCVRLSSTLSGRRYRGRKYFSGLPTPAVVGNVVNSVTAGNIVTGISDLMAALTTNGTPLAIISKTYQIVSPVVAAGVFDLNVDSMRRRLAGRGR